MLRVIPSRRIVAVLSPLFFVVALSLPVTAQEAPPTLTIAEAIEIARRNNPEFLTAKNRETDADWGVREAYGALLPSFSIGTGLNYQAAGIERFGASLANRNRTGYLSSSYAVGLNLNLTGDLLLLPRHRRAHRDATLAKIDVADFNLATNVTRQYLVARRAQATVQLARQEFDRADDNYRLAEARVAAGTAIPLEARQAEVERGRAEVELLRAENLAHAERLRLAELLGVELEPGVVLTSEPAVFEPSWTLDDLVAAAMARHPQLRALRAATAASGIAVRMARAQYLPSISLSTGLSGYDQRATNPDAVIEMAQAQLDGARAECLEMNKILENLTNPMPRDCSAVNFQLSNAEMTRIRAENRGLPFDFSRQPLGVSLQISLPLFNGFSRERQLASARVAEEDAQHRYRREELRIRTAVATAYQELITGWRTVTLEERYRELAAAQLDLARERYSVGAISFIELKDAESVRARADRAYLDAVHYFHESLAALEVAVGSKLEADHEARP